MNLAGTVRKGSNQICIKFEVFDAGEREGHSGKNYTFAKKPDP